MSSPSLKEDENEVRNTNKSKVHIEMNDVALDSSSISLSLLNDGRDEGPTTATTQTNLEIVLGTIKTVDCGTKISRRRKKRSLSLLPPITGCCRNATGVQVGKKKRAYGAIKSVESGIQIESGGAGNRLRLGWDEVKCRPINEHLPRNRQNNVKSPSSATTSLPTKAKIVTSVHYGHDDNEHAHDDVFTKKGPPPRRNVLPLTSDRRRDCQGQYWRRYRFIRSIPFNKK